jgi:hypothetical protein
VFLFLKKSKGGSHPLKSVGLKLIFEGEGGGDPFEKQVKIRNPSPPPLPNFFFQVFGEGGGVL